MLKLRTRLAACAFAALALSAALPTVIAAAPGSSSGTSVRHAHLEVSPAIKQHIMALLPGLRSFALQSLQKQGEFVPVGAALPVQGQPTLEMVASRHSAREMVEALKQTYHRGATEHKYLATSVMYDATKIDPTSQQSTSAIAILFDDQDHFSLKFFFPYRIVGGQVQLGATFYEPGDADIFR
jgi:hypothetical protein